MSEGTGVSTGQITKFVREGRISIADFPQMSYECEVCGASIRESHLCDNCRQRLVKDVNGLKEDEARRAQLGDKGAGYLKDR
ncbi:hypothetical protein MO973_24510 [Paenibacillus sp. TRM 82003]|nr:hypothetical protein [Paenibacillus sp. TRM 82003]MCI3923394.1 hypothetical protein [Paenibacillus sp. TRM 82003]